MSASPNIRYIPNPKQKDFLGSLETFNVLSGGNRTGKSMTGVFKVLRHCLGAYAKSYKGYRFKRRIDTHIVSLSFEVFRDSLQKYIIEFLGASNLEDLKSRHKDKTYKNPFIKSIEVDNNVIKRIVFFNDNTLTIKSMEQRDKLQGYESDYTLIDEEPINLQVFSEIVTRTLQTTKGEEHRRFCDLTFTPTRGMTEVIEHLQENKVNTIYLTWDDSEHLDEASKKQLLQFIPPDQIDARTKGIPNQGGGLIYGKEIMQIDNIDLDNPNLIKFMAVDTGWNFFAIACMAYDKINDIFYLCESYQSSKEDISERIKLLNMLRPYYSNNLIIDTSAWASSQIDGSKLSDIISEAGYNCYQAQKSKEANIIMKFNRIITRRLRAVKDKNQIYIKSLAKYRRNDKGEIIKKEDHIIDAVEYAISTLFHEDTKFYHEFNCNLI